ncbi:MAG: hypothetical protein ABI763_01430 [Bacteroidota bacterium]
MKSENNLLFNSVVLVLYCSLIIFGIQHHELWGDEIHSWNIVKGSHTLPELFKNIRYEGHPPLWYLILFPITQFSHALIYLKAVQLVFCLGTAVLILFFSPFSKIQKVLVLCGYYFVFEYAVLARNYMPAVFIALCIAAIHPRQFKYKTNCYYFLLFLLSNVHLLGLLLAMSIHAGYCYELFRGKHRILNPVIAGMLVFLPAVYFILPPADSQLNFGFWVDQWSVSRLYLFVTVILKSMLPMPEISNPHWWNTNYLLDNDGLISRGLSVLIFIFLLFSIYLAARKSKTAFVILFTNLSLTFLLSLFFPLNTSRYVGFAFVGFMVAAWFSFFSDRPFNKNIFILLLLLQVPAGIFAVVKDYRAKFSSAETVVAMRNEIPQSAFVATDYWCLNNLAAYLDTPVYCLELKRPVSFLIWNSEMKDIIHYDYVAGLEALLNLNGNLPFYFFSIHNETELLGNESPAIKMNVKLIGYSGDAIEKSGRVFLYLVERL